MYVRVFKANLECQNPGIGVYISAFMVYCRVLLNEKCHTLV